MQLMANEKHDYETRLYAMANLAHRLSDFYYKDCSSCELEKLTPLLAELSDGEIMSKLKTHITNYDENTHLSMVVTHSILSIKLQQVKRRKY